jgi:hypothetical protein
MARAKNAGVEDEIRRVYPLEGSRFDLSKNKKGFVQIGKVDDAESALINEAKKYKSAEEFVGAIKPIDFIKIKRPDLLIESNYDVNKITFPDGSKYEFNPTSD